MNSLREALNDSPENLPLRLVYARRCEEALSWSEARTIYEGILEKFPTHPSAHLGIARTHYFQGRISEAEVRVQGLLDNHPKFAQGHLFLCRLLCSDSDGEMLRAAAHYRIALAIDPNLAEPALDRDLGGLIRMVEAAESNASESVSYKDSGSDSFAEEWLSQGEESEIDSPFENAEPGDEGDAGYVDGGFIDALQRGMDKNGMKVSDLDAPTINFADVGGLQEVKESLRMKIVHPIKNPQLFKAYGINAGGSLLLYGPPGCGKTLIAEALDGEVNASLYTIGLHQLNDASNGSPEKQLHEIFHIAKMNAPSVLFLDEVDAIAGRRGGTSSPALVNQLLKELDGLKKTGDGVLVIAATSAPWLLDPAFHRAGRFDQKICVGLPDQTDRVDIIRVLRNRIPVSDLDAEKIAVATSGFSGAELTAVFENAAECAIAASLDAGTFQSLTTEFIISESEKFKPSGESWMVMARDAVERARVADCFRELFDQ